MRYLNLIFLIFILFTAVPAQQITDKYLTFPKVEDISKISISPSRNKWYTRESLIKILPVLIPGGEEYLNDAVQRGTFTLKDGAILKWSANADNFLRLNHGNKIRRFYVPEGASSLLTNPVYLEFLPKQISFMKCENTSYLEYFFQLKIKPFPAKQKIMTNISGV